MLCEYSLFVLWNRITCFAYVMADKIHIFHPQCLSWIPIQEWTMLERSEEKNSHFLEIYSVEKTKKNIVSHFCLERINLICREGKKNERTANAAAAKAQNPFFCFSLTVLRVHCHLIHTLRADAHKTIDFNNIHFNCWCWRYCWSFCSCVYCYQHFHS